MDQSHITVSNGATVYAGGDATALFAAKIMRGAIQLYLRTGMKANRAYTPANMLAAATRITQKPYKRGQLQQAADDLSKWIDTMQAALPVVDKREGK